MVHEHWDGSSRPRNVNYATRRLGDHEPYFSYGSGGPGDVSRGRRGRLEVTLRSYSSVLEYAPERVKFIYYNLFGPGAVFATMSFFVL